MAKVCRIIASLVVLVLAVLFWAQSAASLPHWLASIGQHHHDVLIRWALILLGALSVVAALLLLAGPERLRAVVAVFRAPRAGDTHHHWPPGTEAEVSPTGAVTIRSGPQSATAPTTGRVLEGKPGELRVIRPWELMEPLPHQGPSIFGYTFRYVQLEGPAILAVLGGVDFIESGFGVLDNDLRSIAWDFGPLDLGKLGPIGLLECRFEQCRFESIGFTGTPEFLTELLNKLRPGETS